jgi:hypothetical protein
MFQNVQNLGHGKNKGSWQFKEILHLTVTKNSEVIEVFGVINAFMNKFLLKFILSALRNQLRVLSLKNPQ